MSIETPGTETRAIAHNITEDKITPVPLLISGDGNSALFVETRLIRNEQFQSGAEGNSREGRTRNISKFLYNNTTEFPNTTSELETTIVSKTEESKFWLYVNQELLPINLDDLYLSSPLELEFTPEEPNKLWLTADSDSGAICIRNKLLYSGAITFGFLERFDETDADAWAIAYLNNRLNHARIARSKHDGTIWKQIGSDFASADNFTSATNNGGYQGIIDFVTVANPYISFFNTNLRNAGYSAHFGQVAQTNRPIITRRFYLEGRASIDNYEVTGDNPAKLYNRGFVKHVANGFGKVPQGKVEQDENGNRYLSVGGDGW